MPNSEKLPSGFIDAIIGYALDPTQWELVARELDTRADALNELDPAAFLGLLTQAESLAFQLRSEPEHTKTQAQSPFALLDENMRLVAASDNLDSISPYAIQEAGELRFSDPTTTAQFAQAIDLVRQGRSAQELVELKAHAAQSRYGYLVDAENLPAAFKHLATNARYGLLIAAANSDERVTQLLHQLLQSSFNLTRSETSVALRLSAGAAVKEIASELKISTNTVRNHLQSVFDKTGLNRQADLILMLTQLNVLIAVIGQPDRPKTSKPDSYPPHRFFVPEGSIASGGANPRRVAYRRYGDGEITALYFHETAGTSRLLPGTEQLANQLGLTIIAIERPGSGFSDALARYDFMATASDAVALLDELGVDRTRILGYLSGAGHALAAAVLLETRVEKLMLVAGRGPEVYPADDAGALAVLRRRLVEQPWVLSTFFNILRNRANKETNEGILMRVYGAVPHDRELLQSRADILDHMVDATLENLTVSASGIAGEVRCYSDPKPFDLTKINCPISVWHGSADEVAPLDALRTSLAGLRYDERIFPDHGSLIIYDHWQEVLRHLAD